MCSTHAYTPTELVLHALTTQASPAAPQGVHPCATLPLLWQCDGQPGGDCTWRHRCVPRRCGWMLVLFAGQHCRLPLHYQISSAAPMHPQRTAECFDASATLAAVQQERCTSLYGVPTMFVAQLELPE